MELLDVSYDIAAVLRMVLMTPGFHGRWGLFAILHGAPGGAKTDHVDQAALACALRSLVLHLAVKEPADIGGWARFIDEPGKAPRVQRVLEEELARFIDEPGVCFMDEITQAALAVQAAALRLALEGSVGGSTLHPGVRFLAAANGDEVSGTYDLSEALANRAIHLPMPPVSVEAWAAHQAGAERQLPPVLTEAEVLAAWPEAWAVALGKTSGFLNARRELLHKMPPRGNPEASRGWPSPRSWELATRALAGASIHKLEAQERDVVLRGAVGKGAAGEFLTWLAAADLPNPREIVEGRVRWTPRPDRLDQTCAVVTGVASYASTLKAVDPGVDAAWGLFEDVAEVAPDIALIGCSALRAAKLTANPNDPKKQRESAVFALAAIEPIARR